MRKSLIKGWSWKEVPLQLKKEVVILDPSGKPIEPMKRPMGFGKPDGQKISP
jgi:hypothetical protein